MYSIYSAFLISALTANVDPIKSFGDLVITDFSFFADVSINQQLIGSGQLKQPSRFLKSSYESLLAVLEGGHANIDHLSSFKNYADDLKITPNELCSKISLVPLESVICSGLYIPKNSSGSMREIMNSK
jgi:hypothetical protein